jgi:5-aminolevulinate synthase
LIDYSPGPSHIVPVLVGDAALAKLASDKLLHEHGIYVQAINYPTVAVGEERLRITVTPRHTLEQMDKLVRAVDQIFTELNINRTTNWKLAGGRAGVGMPNASDDIKPIWTDEQLGLHNGTTPRTLRDAQRAVTDMKGVAAARKRFDILLGPMTGALQPNRVIQENLAAAITSMISAATPTAPMVAPGPQMQSMVSATA